MNAIKRSEAINDRRRNFLSTAALPLRPPSSPLSVPRVTSMARAQTARPNACGNRGDVRVHMPSGR